MDGQAQHTCSIVSSFQLRRGKRDTKSKKEDMKGEREGGRRETKGGKERGKNREEDKYREA